MFTLHGIESLRASAVQWLPALFDVAIKGAIILALAWVVARIMRRSSAAARHLVWLGAMVGLIVLPGLSVAIPGWQVLPGWMDVPTSLMRNVGVKAPQVIPSGDDVVPELAEEVTTVTGADVSPSAPVELASAVPDEGFDPLAFLDDEPHTASSTWESVVVGLWALGALAALAPLVVGTVLLRKLHRRCDRVTSHAWADMLARLAGEMGVARRVRLVESDRQSIPAVWGVVRPTILLPGKASRWSEACHRTILLHELAHIRRLDCLTHAIARIACAIHWFNPLVWFALRWMQADTERACDDMVLNAGGKASDYAQHLLRIVGGHQAEIFAARGAAAMARPSTLEGRLVAILDTRRNRRGVTRLGAIIAGILICMFVVPLATLKAAPAAKGEDEPGVKLKIEIDGDKVTIDVEVDGKKVHAPQVEPRPVNHMLDKYPDLPKVVTRDQKMTIVFPDRRYSVMRPVVPELDLSQFSRKIYVDNQTPPGGGGSQPKLFGDLQRAIDAATPGTAILLRGGTYEGPFVIRKSGQPGKPILIAPVPGERVRVVNALHGRSVRATRVPASPSARLRKARPRKGLSSWFRFGSRRPTTRPVPRPVFRRGMPGLRPDDPVITLRGGSHVWIYGLIIEGNRGRDDEGSANYRSSGISIRGGRGCWIANNVIYRTADSAVVLTGANYTVEGNVIFEVGKNTQDNGIHAWSGNVQIYGNVVFKCATYGIHSYSGPGHNVIERNVCYDNRWGGIVLGTPGHKVYNNVCYGNGRWGIVVFNTSQRKSQRNQYYNNILAGNGEAQLGILGELPAGSQIDNNCTYTAIGKAVPRAWAEPGVAVDYNKKFPNADGPSITGPQAVTAAPMFMDAANRDFRLKPGSPCIDAGMRVGAEFAGKAPDIGAFEQ